jgi:hypothetical protein
MPIAVFPKNQQSSNEYVHQNNRPFSGILRGPPGNINR